MGLTDLLKTNMERHSECFGDTLQLCYSDVFLPAGNGIEVGIADSQTASQFCFTYVFFIIAFFKSIFVSFFIVVII